jgi:subtilisin family serine protease
VVVAAGNEGAAAAPGQSNIRHPGAARRVITVGALDKAKQPAPFSSIGPSSGRLSPTSDIRLTKPDLAGPGVAITSTVPGGGFLSLSGTSMASPHVAGLAALVLEQNPGARPLLVKKLPESSCEDLPYDPTPRAMVWLKGSVLCSAHWPRRRTCDAVTRESVLVWEILSNPPTQCHVRCSLLAFKARVLA